MLARHSLDNLFAGAPPFMEMPVAGVDMLPWTKSPNKTIRAILLKGFRFMEVINTSAS
jgi:hypothetical protein